MDLLDAHENTAPTTIIAMPITANQITERDSLFCGLSASLRISELTHV